MTTKNLYAARDFINNNFDAIPLHMIQRGYELGEDLHMLGDYEEWGYPMWATLWMPNYRGLETFIIDHQDEIVELGFNIYETEEGDILLGIDGAGYDFYSEHWEPLYHLHEKYLSQRIRL